MGGYRCERETIEEILKLTQCHPYYTQMLCHIIWEEAEAKKINQSTIEKSMKKLVARESSNYSNIWEGLSQGQKRLLVSIAEEETAEVFSGNFIRRHNLSSPSSIQKSLKTLLEKELLEKTNSGYTVENIFFKQWLRQTF